MRNEAVAFVCEGPTCRDRWDAADPVAAVGRGLAARGLTGRVRVIAEICLGHCRVGPNALTVPVPPASAQTIGWGHPDPLAPGALVHQRQSVDSLVEAIAGRLKEPAQARGAEWAAVQGNDNVDDSVADGVGDGGGENAADLVVAANHELA